MEAKVRDAQLRKIPYIVVIGRREEENGTLSVRKRTNEVKQGVSVDAFLGAVKKEIASRSGALGAA
jgi:threonyl-tRNA synthetase